MPGGTTDPALAYGLFCGVKLAGYTIAAAGLNRAYRPVRRNLLLVGGARTLLGMAVGAAYFGLQAWLASVAHPAGYVVYPIGIAVVRPIEWWCLIWLFYDRKREQKARGWTVALLGTMWSFALDAVGLWSLFATHLVYVC
jgi:hypothetical protein